MSRSAMLAYPVSPRVTNPASDAPDCIAPLAWLPYFDALLRVLVWHGVIREAGVLAAIKRLKAKSVQAR